MPLGGEELLPQHVGRAQGQAHQHAGRQRAGQDGHDTVGRQVVGGRTCGQQHAHHQGGSRREGHAPPLVEHGGAHGRQGAQLIAQAEQALAGEAVGHREARERDGPHEREPQMMPPQRPQQRFRLLDGQERSPPVVSPGNMVAYRSRPVKGRGEKPGADRTGAAKAGQRSRCTRIGMAGRRTRFLPPPGPHPTDRGRSAPATGRSPAPGRTRPGSPVRAGRPGRPEPPARTARRP